MSLFAVIVLADRAYGQSQPPPQPYPAPPPSVVAPQPPPETPEHTLCFSGRPFECASVLLLEVGARIGDGNRAVTSADVGLLIHHGLNAYGGTIGVSGISGGNAKDEANLWFAARYRRYFGRSRLAGDVSVGFAGGPALDIAFGWADAVALTAGVNVYELKDGSHDAVASIGLRLGSVIIGGLLYVTALVFASAR